MLRREAFYEHGAAQETAVLGRLQISVVMSQEGNAEDIAKYSKRTTRVTAHHNEECKELLRLMGVPVVTVLIIPT